MRVEVAQGEEAREPLAQPVSAEVLLGAHECERSAERDPQVEHVGDQSRLADDEQPHRAQRRHASRRPGAVTALTPVVDQEDAEHRDHRQRVQGSDGRGDAHRRGGPPVPPAQDLAQRQHHEQLGETHRQAGEEEGRTRVGGVGGGRHLGARRVAPDSHRDPVEDPDRGHAGGEGPDDVEREAPLMRRVGEGGPAGRRADLGRPHADDGVDDAVDEGHEGEPGVRDLGDGPVAVAVLGDAQVVRGVPVQVAVGDVAAREELAGRRDVVADPGREVAPDEHGRRDGDLEVVALTPARCLLRAVRVPPP